jgi:hypothetical protein
MEILFGHRDRVAENLRDSGQWSPTLPEHPEISSKVWEMISEVWEDVSQYWESSS